jgi:hypothetical protein
MKISIDETNLGVINKINDINDVNEKKLTYCGFFVHFLEQGCENLRDLLKIYVDNNLNSQHNSKLRELIERCDEALFHINNIKGVNITTPLTLFIEYVYANKEYDLFDKLNSVINADNFNHDTLKILTDMDLPISDENILFAIFSYKTMVNDLPIDIYIELFKYVALLLHISNHYAIC